MRKPCVFYYVRGSTVNSILQKMVNMHRKIFKHWRGNDACLVVVSLDFLRLRVHLVQVYRLKVPVERVVKFHFSMNQEFDFL